MKRFLRRLTAALLTLCLLVTGAYALTPEEAIWLLEQYYVDPIPPAVYEAQTVDEVFAALGDPYSAYMDAAVSTAFHAQVEGDARLTGAGITVRFTADGILVLDVLDDGGAKDAGLLPGDLIVAIDGEGCVPAQDAHRDRILGEEGTTVVLRVRHADGTLDDCPVVRRTVEVRNTTVRADAGVGTIRCTSFGSQTGAYFTEGVSAHAGEVSLWRVDLRGNGGGLASAAVAALGVFTGAEKHLMLRSRSGRVSYSASYDDALSTAPVVVLVNRQSASASELFAGGIRAQNAGVILGSRTFGKGTAQTLFDSRNYPDLFTQDSLRLSTYRFFCIDGNTTDRIGVIPTLLLDEADTEAVAALLSAKRPAGDCLRLPLAGWDFYVDLSAAPPAALAALLAALPPQLDIFCSLGNEELCLDPAAAAARLGIELRSRCFTDVSGSAFADSINALAVYRILRGGGDGTFRPEAALTRAELCAMLAQALDLTAAGGGAFSDVPDGLWYSAPVNAAAALGLVRGDGSGRFLPEQTLTQQEFAAVMGRLAAFVNMHVGYYHRAMEDLAAELGETDEYAAWAEWARPGAVTLSDYLTDNDGRPDRMLYDAPEHINPAAPVTRAQAAATLYNTLTQLGLLVF